MNNCDNYGYILIDTDEKKRRFAPKRRGDHYCHPLSHRSDDWIPVAGDPDFGNYLIYRRPIDPGECYELLPLDGVSPCNTEYTQDGVTWVKFHDAFKLASVREAISTPPFTTNIAYRRKKSAPLSVQMLTNAAKELLDKIAAGAGHYSVADFKCNESRALAALIDWKSPKSPDQIAFEKILADAKARCISMDGIGAHMWTAALKHARKS